MITAGCDAGSLTTKAVIIKDNEIAGSKIIRSKRNPEEASTEAMTHALTEAGVTLDDIDYCIGTGYGRKHVEHASDTESEIACHAKGAVWQMPSVKTVIDIGGQDAKAIKIDSDGNVGRYVYNDKCASGTGRFLEIISEALDIKLEDLGDISLTSTAPLTLSNQCVVFAETEIISLISEGKELPDIINALHHAVANRAGSLAKSIGVENDVVMTGGVAKNSGMFRALGNALGVPILKLKDPQINGAIGAALIARDALLSGVK